MSLSEYAPKSKWQLPPPNPEEEITCEGPESCYWHGENKADAMAFVVFRMRYGEFMEMCTEISRHIIPDETKPDEETLAKALYKWAKSKVNSTL